MSWMSASLRSAAIILYFVVATVVVPNLVARLDAVASASTVVRDTVVSVVWGGALVGGMWLLRVGQRRGLI